MFVSCFDVGFWLIVLLPLVLLFVSILCFGCLCIGGGHGCCVLGCYVWCYGCLLFNCCRFSLLIFELVVVVG